MDTRSPVQFDYMEQQDPFIPNDGSNAFWDGLAVDELETAKQWKRMGYRDEARKSLGLARYFKRIAGYFK